MINTNREILFLQPVYKEVCWGGKRLKEDFGFPIPSDSTGEAWVISAHPNGDCRIINGEYKGMTLSRLFETNRKLFGDLKEEKFPLLIKIIDANEDLSIQVHPDDRYAAEYENGSMGKTECWYVLDCREDATIVIGHNAGTKDEMKQMIEEGRWSEFIREIPVKKGDFFQINPGCLHAIKGGTVILETQQNCDITYRIYDYDRLINGRKRELHLKKGMDVIKVPFSPDCSHRKIENGTNYYKENLIECSYYKVYRLEIDGEVNRKQGSVFLNVSVIGGSGSIDGMQIKKGDNFIIPADYGEYQLNGNLNMIMSSVR